MWETTTSTPLELSPPSSRTWDVFIPVAAVALALTFSLITQRYGVLAGAGGPYVVFTAAVVVSAVRSGRLAGLIATALSVMATGFFHLDPLYSLQVDSVNEASMLLLFLGEGVVLSLVSPAISHQTGLVEKGPLIRYSAASGAVILAVVVKLLISPTLSPETVPFMLFYAAIMVAAWMGGPGPGAIATLLATAAAAFLFFEPRFDLRVSDPARVKQLILFLCEGGFISLFARTLADARQRTQASERKAREYWQELRDREQRLRQQNDVLVQVARNPTSYTNQEQTLQELTEAAAKTVGVRRVGIWVFDPSRRILRCLDSFDTATNQHTTGSELRVEQYPNYFRAIEENRSVPAHDARTDVRTREFADNYLAPLGITSMLDAPIRLMGNVAGVICIEHVGPARQWTSEEEQFAGSIADFVALALKREELRIADARNREQASLLDQAHDAIVSLDSEGRVRFWNGGAEQLYGWSSSEILGKLGRDYLAPVDGKSQEIENALALHGEWSGELRQRTRDEREVVVSLRWSNVTISTGARGQLMIGTDVTEQKAMEQKLLRGQRMESLGSLASGIAHDLNNLLTPVLMGAELLETADTPELRASLIATMRNSAERSAALLRQILSFAKGGTSTLQESAVDLSGIVNQITDLLRHTLPKSIQLSVRLADNLFSVPGPSSKIDQVLMNLCVNARDAMPNGGILTMRAENRDVGAPPPGVTAGQFVCATVQDNGTGIPPEVLKRIFDPFFTTKEPGKGTGLGLATTREVVAAMGGFIEIESEVGRGTTFEVFFPAIIPERTTAKPDSAEVVLGRGELILVVDDEASIRELAARILETYGYAVMTAGDGEECLQMCRQSGSTLRAVLMDMQMPGPSTEDTLAELHRLRPELPVVLMTGIGGDTDYSPGLGETAFLPKPYTAAILLRTVRSVL